MRKAIKAAKYFTIQVMTVFFLSLVVATFSITEVFAVPISVPGTSNPWLAGMPDGSTASIQDIAPDQSPVLVTGLDLSLGGSLTFRVGGGVSNDPGFSPVAPDGDVIWSHSPGAENGIADAAIPITALVGVFLDGTQPDSSLAPGPLDFSSIGTSFTSISPMLKQVFFIGDGLTGAGSGASQTFNIPAGATRLFLGAMDGYGWWNNIGEFTVEVDHFPSIVIPPPSSCRHWDKIVFIITDRMMAERLQLPYRSPLDIKVLDDPNSVADLKSKVYDFLKMKNPGVSVTAGFIKVVSVSYAIECPSAAPLDFGVIGLNRK